MYIYTYIYMYIYTRPRPAVVTSALGRFSIMLTIATKHNYFLTSHPNTSVRQRGLFSFSSLTALIITLALRTPQLSVHKNIVALGHDIISW